MNRLSRPIEFIEASTELPLQEFEPLIGRADQPNLVSALCDRELMVHSPAEKPDSFEFAGADVEIGQERRLVRQFFGDGDTNRLTEERTKIRHEVSLPITLVAILPVAHATC